MRILRNSLVVFICIAFVASVLVSCGYDNATGGYSPTPVNPPPQGVSDPSENQKPDNLDSYMLAVQEIIENKINLKTSFVDIVDAEYIDKICEKFGSDAVEKLANALSEGEVDSKVLHDILGYSEKAFVSLMNNDLERTTVLENTENGVTDLVFVGDVTFNDGSSVMYTYEARNKGAKGLVSEEVLEIMNSATITMANNEFTLSKRGSPVPDKTWTFRGNPENVNIYHEMGVDIVGLANNHAFDYGPDSLTDTLLTLDGAGIAHVGAGENLNDAKAPYYYIVNGYCIGIVAGTAIDPWSTRGARENQSGVFQIFDTVSMQNEIIAAKEKADYVFAYVHWGEEITTVLTYGQTYMGKAFIDAGADVVVGMHSHCMQGIEHYNGKLIVYSLGNFVFSPYDLTAAMLKTTINPDGELINTFYPMKQTNSFTFINSGEKGKSQMELLLSLAINTDIADDYVVTEAKK